MRVGRKGVILAMVLAAIILAPTFASTTEAGADDFTVTSTAASPGSNVTIDIMMNVSNAGGTVAITYDTSVFTFVEWTMVDKTLFSTVPNATTDGDLRIVWWSTDNVQCKGVALASITLKVSSSASGSAHVSVDGYYSDYSAGINIDVNIKGTVTFSDSMSIVKIKDGTAKTATNGSVIIAIAGNTEISGYSGSILFDYNVLKYVGYTWMTKEMSGSVVNDEKASQGMLSFSVLLPQNTSVSSGDLMKITFLAFGPNGTVSDISFGYMEFTTAGGKVLEEGKDFILQDGKFRISDSAPTEEDCIISYDANGGTGTQSSNTVTKGSSFTLPSNTTFTREGHTFKGWSLTSSGSIVTSLTSVNADTKVYAIWQSSSKEVTITFNSNGGTGNMEPVKVASGSNYTLPNCGFTREGHNFRGWSTSPNGEIVSVLQSVISDTTVYAIWSSEGEVIISFNANGGSGSMDSVKVASGTDFTLPNCGFTRSGYSFSGWSKTSSGELVSVLYNVTADTTVYAIWHQNGSSQYTITYNANGGTGSQASDKVSAGQTFVLPKTTSFLMEGKTFKGWALSPSGSIVTKLSSVNSDTTVYAIWGDIGGDQPQFISILIPVIIALLIFIRIWFRS